MVNFPLLIEIIDVGTSRQASYALFIGCIE